MHSQKISHYRIRKQLGTSVLGEVYLAEDLRLGRKVALTLLPAEFARDSERLRQLTQEARVLSALNHPNIRLIYEIGSAAQAEQSEAQHFIATEFVEGPTLREHLQVARLKLEEILDAAVQIANGLAAAHAAGVLHRDLRPENVMLRPDGYVKILDFGLAKLVEQEAALVDLDKTQRELPALNAENDPYQTARLGGTVALETSESEQTEQLRMTRGLWWLPGATAYLAPEQVRGAALDERSDIFSFGAVLYEMCSGRALFAGGQTREVLDAILQQTPPPLRRALPEAPEELEWIAARMLAKAPEDRYQTAKELLNDLRRLKQRLEFAVEQEHYVARKADSARAMTPPPAPPTERRSSGSSARFDSGAQRHAINSLAILPLVNASNDPNTEYLSDGVTETLINALSRLSSLRVMARSTVFRYKGRDYDPQMAGAELGVRAVLAGRVLQRGEKLIVKVELIDTQDGALLWAEQYQRPAGDIFALEAEIAKQIFEHLRLKLTGDLEAQLVRQQTTDPEAYHLYLRGRFFWNQRTPDALKRAVQCFLQAIKKDPRYALAHAGLSDCYTLLSWSALPPREFVPKARLSVLKALELDEQLPEAHASLGFLTLWYDWDFLRAEQECLRAIELNPNYATGHQWYAYTLAVQERLDEALERMRHALSLDPLSLIIMSDVGELLYRQRRYDAAIAQCRKALELEPHFRIARYWLGAAYLKTGKLHETIELAEQAMRTDGGSIGVKTLLTIACALAGERERAQTLLAQMQKQAESEYVPPYYLALAASYLGEKEQAFAFLETAYRERSGWIPWLKLDPLADELRTDARFSDLLRRVGLQP